MLSSAWFLPGCDQGKSHEEVNTWHADLIKLGYNTPLPAPAQAIQAVLACIPSTEVHQFVQTADTTALEETDDEGMHSPLLLLTLDLSQWTSIMVVATVDKDQGLARLREAHDALYQLLKLDDYELDEALRITRSVEVALKVANPHVEWTNMPSSHTDITGIAVEKETQLHPLLSRINIAETDKAAIEDLSECIQTTQMEKEVAALESRSKGSGIPFTPHRRILEQLNYRGHQMWRTVNCNLEAPIGIPVWKLWTNMTEQEIKTCEERALSCGGTLMMPVEIVNAFPLNMFDKQKCGTPGVRIQVKNDVQTHAPRHEKYISHLWNCQRPYLRCTCDMTAKEGCQGDVLWFDQAIWYMINNLDKFFDQNYPSLAAKFGAFLVWLSGAAKPAVKAQVSFKAMRRMMEIAALEFSVDPTQQLLQQYYNAPGARRIERLFKPASFSTHEASSPSTSATLFRKRKGRNPHTPDFSRPLAKSANSGGSPAGYNQQRKGPPPNRNQHPPKQARQAGRAQQTERAPTSSEVSGSGSRGSPASISRSSVSISEVTPPMAMQRGTRARQQSPIKGRVLNWADL